MSDIDLTAAAAWAAYRDRMTRRRTDRRQLRRRDFVAGYTAAAPLIEQAVREQVAQEIEAEMPTLPMDRYDLGRVDGVRLAARIARGGAR